jgi:hypothetical protein
MKLKEILDAITAGEEKLLPVLITNPQTQAIAGLAFVAEQTLFSIIEKLHAPMTAATTTPAAA